MTIDKNSIQFKILAPLFVLIPIITALMLLIIALVAQNISEDYQSSIIMTHVREVKGIISRELAELVSSKLIAKDTVLETAKKTAIRDIAAYWQSHHLEGCITAPSGKVLYATPNSKGDRALCSGAAKEGLLHPGGAFNHHHAYIMDLPAWNWKIATVVDIPIPWYYKKKIFFLIAGVIACGAVLIGSVFLILEKNFHRPLTSILSDLRRGEQIKESGITELDTIGSAIQHGFNKLTGKTKQYQAMHAIAIALHEDASTEEMLKVIIGSASELIKAGLSAIALFADDGAFKQLITTGDEFKAITAIPEGKGVLELLRYSPVPVRFDDVPGHPMFSGVFPQGHPVIRNLLSYPIFSENKKLMGLLFFGNKKEGFNTEDDEILKAISADAAIALGRAEKIAQLKLFKQVIDSAFDAIMLTDSQGCITYVNPAFETLTEYAKTEVTGKKASVLNSGYHDTAFFQNMWNTIKSGDVWRGEFVNKKKSGEIYYASAAIFAIHTENGISYASTQRDITQEKRLYEQLLRSQKMEAIGTLAGGIAHDFNNLLTAILGYAEIMSSFIKEGDQFYKPVTIIFNAAERGADLAKKILMMTRKEKIETKPVNINQVISSSMDLLQRSIPKNIEITTNLSESLPPTKADPSQIQQVIMNLAVNARDAMPDGGKLIIETELMGIENGAASGVPEKSQTFWGGSDIPPAKSGLIKLSISDTGTGMDTETQRKIFDPFFTTKEMGKGTGLGLYIVHSVISNHGGYINLYSEPDKGTRFNIYLPITKDFDETSVKEFEDISGTETVLVIDDDPEVRELCRDMLVPLGYTVFIAGSGEEGITLFRQHRDAIALVVLDMIMPKAGGNEVFQTLRTIDPDVRVLLCSGYSYNGFAGIDKLLKGGAKSFLQKPFTRQALGHAVRKALAG